MKDFRIPYKDNSNQNASSSDQNNSDYRTPPTFQKGGSSFGSFIVLVGVISAISVFSWIGWKNLMDDSTTSTSNSQSTSGSTSIQSNDIIAELDSYLGMFLNQIQNIMQELDSYSNSDGFEPIADDSTSIPVEGNVFYISEYHYGFDGKDYIVYGILDNTSEIAQEEITISAKDPKTEESFIGEVYSLKLYPHKKIPFIIPMNGWKGENEIEFYTDSKNSQENKIAPLYLLKAGEWKKKDGIWNYYSEFTNLDSEPLESGYLVLVIRDSDDKILNFVAYTLPISGGALPVAGKINVEIPFETAIDEPEKTQIYFTRSM
jgi:hypothetical protein